MTQHGQIVLQSLDEHKARQRKNRLINWLFAAFAAAFLTGFGLLYTFALRPTEIDEEAQMQAAIAYMHLVERTTNGDIKLDTDETASIGERHGKSIQVKLIVGDCDDVTGFIDSPKRPTSRDELGPLYISVAGSGRFPTYAYPVIHFDQPGWSKPLTRGDSSLNHCLDK